MRPRVVEVGETYGDLTVIERREAPQSHVLCVCVCGATTSVSFSDLTTGNTRSCGCLVGRKAVATFTTHGRRHTPEYEIWANMLQRTGNPNHIKWPDYGARGITVCERWRNDFGTFYADMGPRPTDKHSIDRIDNDGNYEPGNCRWATASEQRRNQRRNKAVSS